mgnify:CR=1 FL=1
MDDLALIDEIVRRADEYQKQKEIKFAIEELEKIKEEMEADISDYLTAPTEFNKGYDGCLKRYIGFVEKQISELNGENNEH